MRRRIVFWASLGLVVLLALPAVALAKKKPTHVKFTSWTIEAVAGATHTVAPGKTFTACASDPTHGIDAKGKVTRAKKGKAFKEVWMLDGQVTDVFNDTWGKQGAFNDVFGIFALLGAIETGSWKVKLVQGGKKIGASSLKLATDSGC